MQALHTSHQPQTGLPFAVRALVAVPVVLALAAVVAVASAASQQAVEHMTAQLQNGAGQPRAEGMYAAARHDGAGPAAGRCTAARHEAG